MRYSFGKFSCLYVGGFSSDSNSLIGPYSLVVFSTGIIFLKKHGTEILGPTFFASTLCSELLKLPLDTNCKEDTRTTERI